MGQVENICNFTECFIVNNDNADNLLNNLFDYVTQHLQIENIIRLNDRTCGKVARTETYGNNIVGTIERLDINLRAKKANSRIVGGIEWIG